MTSTGSPILTMLTHNRVHLALHTLRPSSRRPGRPLLLLHGLGEQTPADVPEWAAGWPGSVHGLDFTGHGSSTLPAGGGYTAEMLLADADAALAHLVGLGEADSITVVGRGLGAYVALMLAGARASQVRGAVLCDGSGLIGGATQPTSQSLVTLQPATTTPDPYALHELSHDLRPPDYATLFVRLAVEGSGLDQPISVAAVVRPPWLAAVVGEYGVATLTASDRSSTAVVAEALAGYR